MLFRDNVSTWIQILPFFFSLETTAKFHVQHKNSLHSWLCGPIHYCILLPLPSYPKLSLTNLEEKRSLNSVTNVLWLLYLSWLSLTVGICPKPEVKWRLYCSYYSVGTLTTCCSCHKCWIYTSKNSVLLPNRKLQFLASVTGAGGKTEFGVGI